MKKKFISMACALAMVFGTPGYLPQNVLDKYMGISVIADTYGDFEYTFLDENSIEITKYNGSDAKLTIPDTIAGKPVISISDYAFYNCLSLTSVRIPNSVTSMGDDVFSYCTNLTNAQLPNNMIEIPDREFVGCSKLTSITIPDGVTSIGEDTFSCCESLMSVTIPNSVKNIGSGAFSRCSSLKSINIPNGLTSIGDTAFWLCESLINITIPESVISIEPRAFSGCSSLTEIHIDEKNDKFCFIDGVLFNKEKTTIICFPANIDSTFVIPYGVTDIGDFAFSDCNNLITITIPDSVTSIGEAAFFCCDSLTNITIPDSVTSIDEYAFSRCENLISLEIPDSISSINNGVFENCLNLLTITIPDSVTSIGEYAFSSCESLTHLTIPDSVISIGDWAFYDCISLTSMLIPNSVTRLGTYAFYYCSNLEDIIISNNLSSIESSTFEKCISLSNITILNGVTDIGYKAFNDCTSLKEIIIPNSVISIGVCSFEGCTNLESVTLLEGLECIGNRAFSGCTSLKSITIPASVINICNGSYHSKSLDIKLFCYKNTEGEKFAIKYGYEYELIPDKHEHVLAEVTFKDATCTETGNIAYWYCSTCDKYFLDLDGRNEINKDSTKIKANGHTWDEWIVITPATEDKEGVEKHDCINCNKSETRSIPKLEKQPDLYTYVEKETEWAKDSNEATTLTIHRSDDDYTTFEKFTGVEVDGKIISPDNYTAEAGSLKLTFKPEYLESLSVGKHTVKVLFTDGEAEAVLKISSHSETEYSLGDVNADGKINVTDITKVAAHIKGKRLLDDAARKRADVNHDEKINVTDITKIAAHIKGKRLLS